MRAKGIAALDAVGPDAPPLLQQQLLMISLLGAYKTGGFDAVRGLEDTYGRHISVEGPYGLGRAFLLVRADATNEGTEQGAAR